MPDSLISFNISATLNIIMLIVLLYLILNNGTLKYETTRAYTITIVLTISVMIAEILAATFDYLGSGFRIPNMIVNMIGFIFSTCIPITLAALFENKAYKIIRLIYIPVIIHGIFILVSPWTGWMFHISIQNEYVRGPLFWIYIVTYVWGGSILIHAMYTYAMQFQEGGKNFIAVLCILFFCGTSIQIAFPAIRTSWHCITIVLVSYYVFLCELQFKYDITTGLLNRQAFEKELLRLEKLDLASAIIFDIDKFKEINDTYGHQKGDYYLNSVANIIKESFKACGKCYRMGGDEFCVLSVHADEEIINCSLQQIDEAINLAKKDDPIMPYISYGYSYYERYQNHNMLTVLKEADRHLYEQKKEKKRV